MVRSEAEELQRLQAQEQQQHEDVGASCASSTGVVFQTDHAGGIWYDSGKEGMLMFN